MPQISHYIADMDSQTALALLAFGLASSFTPGPNNLMLMASGANFGIPRTLPHLAGVILGFSLMIVIVGVGIAGLFKAWPPALVILKILSVAYTLWLAWKISRASAPGTGDAQGKPMTFVQAAAFQWVNPKGWSMALTAIALYAPDQRFYSILLIAAVFGVIGIGSAGSWMTIGRSIRRWLSSDRRLIVYNYTMALLLVASIAVAL